MEKPIKITEIQNMLKPSEVLRNKGWIDIKFYSNTLLIQRMNDKCVVAHKSVDFPEFNVLYILIVDRHFFKYKAYRIIGDDKKNRGSEISVKEFIKVFKTDIKQNIKQGVFAKGLFDKCKSNTIAETLIEEKK